MQSRRTGILANLGAVLLGGARSMGLFPPAVDMGHSNDSSKLGVVAKSSTTTAAALKRASRKAKGRNINKQRHKGK